MKNKDLFLELWKHLKTLPDFKQLSSAVKASDYLTAPASTKYHSNYDGGLVDHSVNVTYHLIRFTEMFQIQWERPESPYLIGLFHDWCKVNFYTREKAWRKDDNDKWEQYDTYGIDNKDPLGHGSKSVILLQQIIKLTKQEVYCILFHMGAFGDKDYQRDYSSACVKYPEIMYVALADQLAGVREDQGFVLSEYLKSEEKVNEQDGVCKETE